ncbi:hypothetical protein MBLNU230_g4020t1 [Neophaeotheca triangularis]
MPPSWPNRLLSSTNSSSASSNTPSRPSANDRSSSARDKHLPRPPVANTGAQSYNSSTREGLERIPPTLNPNRVHSDQRHPSPLRPPASGSRQSGQHSHGRSVSHPLPRLFGRKKSTGNLKGYADTDVPLDDSLVPVLDDPDDGQGQGPTPTRVVSGKKNAGASKGEDDGDRAQRQCMCCDNKVRVPRELERYRCMACLTINDLRTVGKEKVGEQGATDANRLGPGGMGASRQVSVERTRAIIDRCLMAYLEARCRRQGDHHAASKSTGTPIKIARTPDEELSEGMGGLGLQPSARTGQSGAQNDAHVASSPPDTYNELTLTASATIRDFSDFDMFAFQRTETPPPGTSAETPGLLSTGLARKPLPPKPGRKPPPPPVDASLRPTSQRIPAEGEKSPHYQQHSPRMTPEEIERRKRYDRVKTIFRPLEDYMIDTYGDYQCLNGSFSTVRPLLPGRAKSESNIRTPPPEPIITSSTKEETPMDGLSELDAKTLLLGDIGENGSWWAGRLDKNTAAADKSTRRKKVGEGSSRPVSSKTPNINWTELSRWYDLVQSAGEDWREKATLVTCEAPGSSRVHLEGPTNEQEIEEDLAEARSHASRALLKISENVLKRPTRPLREAADLRFSLIILSNPALYPSWHQSERTSARTPNGLQRASSDKRDGADGASASPTKSPRRESSAHHGILKRIFGLLANSPDSCHRYLIGWFSRFDEHHFVRTVDLVASFVTNRLARRSSRPHSKSTAADGGLIPDLSGSAMNTSAQLHAAMGLSGSIKNPRGAEGDQQTDYADDWQIKVAAKLMSLLFAANNSWQGAKKDGSELPGPVGSGIVGPAGVPSLDKTRIRGQLLHTSAFYNTLLDYHDLIADFKLWESKREKFAFCQYPLFLSMGSKIKILEFDARRQMEIKAREAYFDQVIRQRAIDGYFHLRIRRDCLVDDSLRQISQASGAGQEELKKGLRVHFTGEEGVDAGGPRKEWFLMLVRDIFDPNHGLFVYDEDSHTCYFNPYTFEASEQYYLVGALLGLAIYNSTILDIALPPFAFRKLLASAPSTSISSSATSNLASLTGTKGQMTYTLSDLAEFRPQLAAGLQQLLDFEGDVAETYCRDFVAPIERYDTTTTIPLIPNGENTPVTNTNRHEFVEAYVRYLLDTAVIRQFEPFKRGFFTVCAGNALSLFRAEEIELLVRGSDESLDVDSLRAVAVYENWRQPSPPHQSISRPAETVPVIGWFWDAFASASPKRQRQLLTFLTGSDRIPAVGATSLVLRVVAGGDGAGGGGKAEQARFPVARTCFNMLVLWRYQTREVLEEKLWRAVEESEGFGLK